ncbi:MAG: imelysin family protein [Bacteroidia bacterium]
MALLLASCEKEKPNNIDSNFNRAAMLEFYADEIIFPAYTQSLNGVETLHSKAELFANNPDTSSLIALQESWKQAVISWQSACAFNFGPAGEDGIRKSLPEEIATFPVSSSKIDAVVAGSSYNLNDFNRDARGFFSIQYLIFDQNISLQALATRYQSENRKNYLLALCEDLTQRISSIKNVWSSSYRNEFINNAGTDAGSSTSMLYNEFVKSYEGGKNFKLGLPLGLRPGQTGVEPELLEAYYSSFSFPIIKAHFQAMENIWRGGSSESGFKAYLKTVDGGEELITRTESQLSIINNSLNAIEPDANMNLLLFSEPTPFIDLHTELQKNTKNFKSDLSSLIGIAITYSSGDGD